LLVYSEDKGLIFRIYKESKKFNAIRKNSTIHIWVNELNKSFSEVQIDSKCMRKCSTSLAIKEMKMKMILIFHLTPVRMTIIKKTNNKSAGADAKEKEPSCTVSRIVN
jgi:hypothetical protein